MQKRQLVYRSRAREDIRQIARWLAFRVSRQFANTYVGRIRTRMRSFEFAAERGTIRDDVGVGVRVIGLMPSITIAFVVKDDRVVILRILYGGQDWQVGLPVTDFDD